MKLTQQRVDKLKCKPGQKDQLVFDDDQRGLAVRVTAGGSRTYLAQYTLGGAKRRVPLGSCDAVLFEDASLAVQAIMGAVAMGRDPAAERKQDAAAARAKAERERLTLSTLVGTWQRLHLVHKRGRYAQEAVRALQRAFARQWEKPAEDLDRTTVVRALDTLVQDGSMSMASRTGAYGRACYQWAVKRGTVAMNPFAALPSVGASPKRDRVLTDDELAAVWRASATVPPPFGRIVQMLMLTGQRREEVAGMTWSEVSDDLATWIIPADRTKNATPHGVPLSQPARDLLQSLPRSGDVVMPGDTGGPFNGWSKSKARLDAASGVTGWTLHDLRRSLATGLQRLGVRLEVTEAVLNHTSGSRAGIVGVYQRHHWSTEKRAALDAWAAHLLAVVENHDAPSNVVKMAAGC